VSRLGRQRYVTSLATSTRTQRLRMLLTGYARNNPMQTGRRVNSYRARVRVTVRAGRQRERNIPVRNTRRVTTKTIVRRRTARVVSTVERVLRRGASERYRCLASIGYSSVYKTRTTVYMSRIRRVRIAVTVRAVLVTVKMITVSQR
jgi:hypothetical protein